MAQFIVSAHAPTFRKEVMNPLKPVFGRWIGERRIVGGAKPEYALTTEKALLLYRLDPKSRVGVLFGVAAGSFNSPVAVSKTSDTTYYAGERLIDMVGEDYVFPASVEAPSEAAAPAETPVNPAIVEIPENRVFTRALAGRMFLAEVKGASCSVRVSGETNRHTMVSLKTAVTKAYGKDADGVSQDAESGVITADLRKLPDFIERLKFA